MRMRSLMFGMMIAGLAAGSAAPATADLLELDISTNPQSYGPAEIRVDGPSVNGSYTTVLNTSLDYKLSLRSLDPDGVSLVTFVYSATSPVSGMFQHTLEFEDYVSSEWRQYDFSIPYVGPWESETSNHRMSPVAFCNDVLDGKTGAARQAMLKNGFTAVHHGAYWFHAATSHYIQLDSKDLFVPVKITCLPLDRIRPHTQSTTKPAGPAPKPQTPKPTISELSLRIEPAQIVQDGKFLCPQQLKLYGHVEVIRKFGGKSIFVGPHFLSPISALSFQAAGERTIVGTYAMDWHKMGGLTTAPNVEPKKQKLTFRFNVSNERSTLLKLLPVWCG